VQQLSKKGMLLKGFILFKVWLQTCAIFGESMARLQKKKTSSTKKKKKSVVNVSSSQTARDIVAKQPKSSAGSAREAKKKQNSFQKKLSSRTPAERGKLKTYTDNGLQFLRDVKVELKKVTWPSRKQTLSSTVVVIILVLIISLFLGLVDIGLTSLISVVLK
jgi:preprotein translocase subunit SecE